MLTRTVTYAALVIAGVSQAQAQTSDAPLTGTQFINDYDAGDANRRLVFGLMAKAVEQGILFADTLKPGAPLYCPPRNISLTRDQIIQLIRNEPSLRPKIGDLPYVALIMGALQDNFPCSGH